MIYLEGPGVKVIVLETANLDEIRKGRPAQTPDGSVLIAWTPDPAWLSAQIAASDGNAELIGRLIDEAARRPETPLREYFQIRKVDFGKEDVPR